MTRAQRRTLAGLVLAALGAVAVALWARGRAPSSLGERPAAERPTLLLLTGLPLTFGEEFSLTANGSPVLTALERRYRVVAIGTSDPAALARARLLLMAQPLAQPAEQLVALDAWVSRGGRVLLLADPRLEWPSTRPLGDPLAPPPMFADTGLLGHWGLRLDAPDAPGPRSGRIGGIDVMTGSPGTLVATGAGCRVERGGLAARCRVGRGQATVIADADFLNGGSGQGNASKSGLAALMAELALLEGR